MSLTFLELDISHAQLCATLDSECFESEVFSEDMLTSFLKTPYVFGYLAIKGEDVIGYTLASIAGKQGDLLSISILPNARGNGYGRELLMKLLTESVSKGIKELFLEVRPSNKGAISLYESFGGVQTGIRKNYYVDEKTGKPEDALVIRLPV